MIGGTGNSASLTFNGDNVVTGQLRTGVLKASCVNINPGAGITATTASGFITLNGGSLAVSGTLTGGVTASNQSHVQIGSLATGGGLSTDGTSTIEVGTAGDAAAGALTIDPGATLTYAGFGPPGLLTGSRIVDNGIITASGTIASSLFGFTGFGSASTLSGSGQVVLLDHAILSRGTVAAGSLSFQLGKSAGLTLGPVGAGNTISLNGGGDQLTLGAPGSMNAAISGFNATSVVAPRSNWSVAPGSTGSALTLAVSLTIGDQSAGELSVLNAATVSALHVTIGNASSASSGNVDVEGAGSRLLIGAGGSLNIGVAGGGSGVLTVGPGATLTFGGTIVESGHASFNNNGGVVDPDAVEFTTTSNGGTGLNEYDLYVGNIGAVQVSAGTGTWLTPMVLTGTSVADAADNINNNGDTGQWQLSQSGTFIVNANTIDAGQAIVFQDATDTLIIGQVVNGGSAGVSGQVPTIAPGAMNLLQAGGFDAQIWGYQAGDKIEFNNMIVSSDSIVNGNTLDLFDSSNTLLGSLTFFNKAGNKPLALAGMQTAADQIRCFAEGTMIETVTGPRRVESLAVGDVVVTLLGGPGRIVWVGSRAVDCGRHPRPEAVWPVRIAAGAFGENVPACDLFVSPDHAIYTDGVLVPAKLLIHGMTIRQVKRRLASYHHVELERHDVILAEGLPVESYLDTADRANFNLNGVAIRLFPDFGGGASSRIPPRCGKRTARRRW